MPGRAPQHPPPPLSSRLPRDCFPALRAQLDIDNAPVEQALMKQIEDDPALQGMISEMFFEQHFTDKTVRNHVWA